MWLASRRTGLREARTDRDRSFPPKSPTLHPKRKKVVRHAIAVLVFIAVGIASSGFSGTYPFCDVGTATSLERRSAIDRKHGGDLSCIAAKAIDVC